MESLTGPMPRETEEKADSKSVKTPDRVTLGKQEGDKVERWLAQINASSRGFLALTKSDVVNFLIRNHKDEFLPKELLQIRADHYDPIRHITWITPQIKAALASGDLARVAELQEELRGVELSVVREALDRSDARAENKKKRHASLGVSRRRGKQESVKDEATPCLPEDVNRHGFT